MSIGWYFFPSFAFGKCKYVCMYPQPFRHTFVLVLYGLLSPCRHSGTCINSRAVGVKETGARVAGQMRRDGAQATKFHLVVKRDE